MSTEFWVFLLRRWCVNRRGLTLPFLAGAVAVQEGRAPYPEDASHVLSAIRRNDTPGWYYVIERCPDIKAPVISLFGYPPRSGCDNRLDATWGGTDEERLDAYETDARALVGSGKLSRIDGELGYAWGPFSEEDLAFISAEGAAYDSAD